MNMMIYLLKSELKKVFAHRFLVLLLFLLLLCNVVMVWRTSYPENKYGPYVDAMLDSYLADPEGFLAEVKAQEEYLATIDVLQNEHIRAETAWEREHPGEKYPIEYPAAIPLFVDEEWLSDEDAIAEFYGILNRAEVVATSKDNVIERAKAFYSFYQSMEGARSFAARYQVKLANSYIAEDREAVTYPIAYAYGWDNYLTWGGDSVFLLLAAILVGTLMLMPERNSGFVAILRVPKRGRSHTMLMKGAVCLLFSFGLSLLFSGVTIAAFEGRYGLEGAGLPLQSFFPYAILHLTVWQAVLVRILFRALAAFCVMMLCVLLSVFFKRTITVYLCGGGVVLLFYAFSRIEVFHEHSPLHLFNIFTMLSGGAYLESWNAVSIFGLCADYSIALPLVLIGTGVLLLLASTVAFSRVRVRGQRHG